MYLQPHSVHVENNVHANFHCGVSANLRFCYKIPCDPLKCPLQISRVFSVTRTYVHIRWDVREALSILSLGSFFLACFL